MIIPFIWGIFIGVISGVAAVIYWVVTPGKKVEIQIPGEIEKPEPNPLDITPELATGAYNVLRQYCKNQVGYQFGCPFKGKICHECFYEKPEDWPELEVSYVQKQ